MELSEKYRLTEKGLSQATNQGMSQAVTVDKARHATGRDSEINRDLFAEWGRGGEQGEVQEKKGPLRARFYSAIWRSDSR